MSAAVPLLQWWPAMVPALVLFTCWPVPVGAGSACPGSSVTCPLADDAAEGALDLLQFGTGRHAHPRRNATGESAGAGAGDLGNVSMAAASLVGLRALRLGAAEPAVPQVDCARYPVLCEAPFNCDTNPPQLQDLAEWATVGVATKEGHSNLRTWCGAPQYADNLVKHCLKNHDLKTSAQALFDWVVANDINQLDGSYCFMEGHCTNMDVTYNTTVEEAEALCDAKYGHDNWTSFTFKALLEEYLRHPLGASKDTGFHTLGFTSGYGMAACAMGNFHCDVIYCRDTYCKMPEYVQKYGHYLKDLGYSS